MRLQMDNVWQVLQKYNVNEVCCAYSGSGDSGCFDAPTYVMESDNLLDSLKTENVQYLQRSSQWNHMTKSWEKQTTLAEMTLDDVLTEIAHEVLGHYHGGWENNDGGEGRVIFRVTTYSVSLEHREFVSSYNDYEYELDATPPALQQLAAVRVEVNDASK